MRLLDAEGRTWLDADLAGGTLVAGHAHPAVVEAISRQATLCFASSLAHEGEVALAEAVADRFTAAERVLFRPSGGEAWRAAGLLARRATGRATVATWHAADLSVDSAPDDVILLPPDGAQAAALLAIAAHRLAAVVVDPVLAARLPGLPHLAATLSALTGRGVLLVADERRGLGTGVGGGCARLGLEAQVIVFGESLFGGLSGGMVASGPELFAAGDALGSTGPALAVGPLQTMAGLETLRLASVDALAQVGEQAGELRRRWGTPGLGNTAFLPAGLTTADLAAQGVLVGGDGEVFLATIAGRGEVDELGEAVERAGGARPAGQR
jgi:glutamate-1-semialdehyde 2,1-aminomutase